jgi:type VI secretion system protein VasJ
MDSPESAWEAVRQTRDVLRRASRLLRQQNADDPSAYHLLRESLWSDVGDPPQQEQGKTSLAGGDAEFARELENLIACGRSREAIARAEDRLCEEPYWLDLSFVSYRAMEDLGRSFAAARRAIGNDVAALLRRAPWIATLRFSSGVPFTSERTLLWVSNELHAGPRDKSRTPEDPLRELAERARVHVARGQLAEATALIEQELRAASHRRERFRWRLLLAKLCRESGRPTLALPQLRALDEEAAKYFVEEWEPSLVIELLKEMWYTSQALSLTEDVTRLHARLCRLDLSAAMAMDGQTP